MSTDTSTALRFVLPDLLAAKVDIGDAGNPGDGATQIVVELIACPDGTWRAEGNYADGTNQGYFQENYSYGPWIGSGDSPNEAVEDMVERCDEEYQDSMERAAHDAMSEVKGRCYASLALEEARTVEQKMKKLTAKTHCVRVGMGRYGEEAEYEAQQELRQRAIAMLRDAASQGVARAARLTDDEILVEFRRRGLVAE